MIRFLLRFLGLWVLAAAFVGLVIDGTKWIAGNPNFITKLRETWYDLSPNTLAALEPAAEPHGMRRLLLPIIHTVLEQPIWLVLGILGSLLIVLGRKKKPLIGYSRD